MMEDERTIHELSLLDALLDSWERNNTVLLNVLHVLPESAFKARPTASSPSIAQLFSHIHHVRLWLVLENAPEFARDIPDDEWKVEASARLADKLKESAKAVRDAVRSRVEKGQDMELHYDHPILMLQHLLWHEGYHHGQMKLALKMAGQPMSEEEAARLTWDVLMDKT